MNMLDTLIKNMLLSYPTLYRNRLEALRAIFFKSSETNLNKKGEFTKSYLAQFTPLSREAFISKAGDDLERAEFALRYDNIDLYVDRDSFSTRISPEIAYMVASNASWGSCVAKWALFNLPEKLHPDIFDGALELARQLDRHLRMYRAYDTTYTNALQSALDKFLDENDIMRQAETIEFLEQCAATAKAKLLAAVK